MQTTARARASIRSSDNAKVVFFTLEAMRGIAALLIVDRHVGWLGAYNFPISGMAVDLFFLLSGAVIAHSYEHKLLSGELTLQRYLTLRLIRLYPLYALFTLIGFAQHAGTNALTSADLLKLGSSLLFVPCKWIDGSGFPFDGPAWSIFFELIISMIYGVALYNKPIKTLVVIAAAGAALFTIQALNQPRAVDLAMTCQAVFETGVARVMFSFSYGVIIYRLASRAKTTAKVAHTVPALAVIALFAASAILVLPFEDRATTNTLIAIALLVALPICVFIAILAPAPKCLHAAYRRLGDISYPVYVAHVPLYKVADYQLKHYFHIDVAAYAPISGFMYLFALIPFAYALHHYFDAPIRSRLRDATAPVKASVTAAFPL